MIAPLHSPQSAAPVTSIQGHQPRHRTRGHAPSCHPPREHPEHTSSSSETRVSTSRAGSEAALTTMAAHSWPWAGPGMHYPRKARRPGPRRACDDGSVVSRRQSEKGRAAQAGPCPSGPHRRPCLSRWPLLGQSVLTWSRGDARPGVERGHIWLEGK